MNYTIEKLKDSSIVYMRNIGPYGGPNNFKMMADLKGWISNNNLQKDLASYGIWGMALDNPQQTPPEECRYDLILCISNQDQSNSEVKVRQFKGGNYAVFTIPHTTEEVQQFWADLGKHITQNKLNLRDEPIIERFKEEEGLDKFCDFLIPIQ